MKGELIIGLILLSISIVLISAYIYVEKKSVEKWHEDYYPRDERGRISGRKERVYYNRLADGRVINTDALITPGGILLILGLAITVASLVS